MKSKTNLPSEDDFLNVPTSIDVEQALTMPVNETRQKLNRMAGFKPAIDDVLFRQCAEVAKLAVELSRAYQRENIATNPADYLQEAATLIQSSAALIAVNPALEKQAASEHVKKAFETPVVPYSRLQGIGATRLRLTLPNGEIFTWEPFASDDPKGFNQLATKHMHRKTLTGFDVPWQFTNNQEPVSLKDELLRCFAVRATAVVTATDRLQRFDPYDDGHGHYEHFAPYLGKAVGAVSGKDGAARAGKVFELWLELCLSAYLKDDILPRWRKDGVPLVDIHAMAESRREAHKSRGKPQRNEPPKKRHGSEGTASTPERNASKRARNGIQKG